MGFQKEGINSQLNSKMLKYSPVALLALSVLDAILTLIGLSTGKIEEVNPLMRWLIERSLLAFMAYKLALPAILFFIVWWAEKKLIRVIDYLLGVTLVEYVAVMGSHIWWIIHYGSLRRQ